MNISAAHRRHEIIYISKTGWHGKKKEKQSSRTTMIDNTTINIKYKMEYVYRWSGAQGKSKVVTVSRCLVERGVPRTSGCREDKITTGDEHFDDGYRHAGSRKFRNVRLRDTSRLGKSGVGIWSYGSNADCSIARGQIDATERADLKSPKRRVENSSFQKPYDIRRERF